LELEPRFYQIPNPGQFGLFFNEGISARHEISAKMVTRKGSSDWGVADLSEQRFKEDPHYLERIITEVTQLNKKMLRALPANDPTQKPEIFRGFFMATPSKPIAGRARAMGAKVKEVYVEAKSRVDLKKGSIEFQANMQTYYTLEFDAATAKAITQDFSIAAPPASFKEGLKQVQYDFLTSF
ncbi:MAG: hypothetical protein H7333_02370, partial [Bdellovibrionales bacterium]|nr:hypothetical protein [Oligoflexia bacterium]